MKKPCLTCVFELRPYLLLFVVLEAVILIQSPFIAVDVTKLAQPVNHIGAKKLVQVAVA